MATRTVVCPECREPVPYGRLSCPACGSLLASVAGAPRRPAALQAVEVAAEPPALVADDRSNGHVDAPAAVAATPAGRSRRTTSRSSRAAAPPAAATAPEPREPAVEPEPPADDVAPAGAPGDLDDAAEPAPPEVELPPDPPAARAVAPDGPRWPGEAPSPAWSRPVPPVLHEWPPEGTSALASDGRSVDGAAPGGAAWPPPASAFGLQPATTTSEVVAPPHPRPVLPDMPAGAWLPPSASFGPAQPNGATRGNGLVEGAVAPTDAARPGQASFFADLPFDKPGDLAGWLLTLGAGLALIGFFLPWTAAMPFTTDFGYTSRWGLAVPSHWLLLLASLGLLISSLRPSRIPAWLRSGVVPLVLGGLLLGIVWPFVIGGFRSDVGSVTVGVGAMILAVGGGLAVRGERHGGLRSGV